MTYIIHAVRCSHCNLLVAPGRYNQAITIPGNHEPEENEEGWAYAAETPKCPGSELLGKVESVEVERHCPGGFVVRAGLKRTGGKHETQHPLRQT